MTPKHRNALLAKVHIAKTQLRLDDETYRALLRDLFGQRNKTRIALWERQEPSAKDLVWGELEDLLRHFLSRGFKAVTPKRVGKEPPPQRDSKEGYLGKINALLAEAGRPWAYAHGVAKHMFGVDQVHWCDEEQLRKVVAALSIDARRHKRAEA